MPGKSRPAPRLFCFEKKKWLQGINAPYGKWTYESWFNESMNQWIDEPMNQWIKESVNRGTSRHTGQVLSSVQPQVLPCVLGPPHHLKIKAWCFLGWQIKTYGHWIDVQSLHHIPGKNTDKQASKQRKKEGKKQTNLKFKAYFWNHIRSYIHKSHTNVYIYIYTCLNMILDL